MAIRVEVPTSLSQVTLNDYLNFVNFESENEKDVIYKAFECFIGLSKEEVNKLPSTLIDKVQGDIITLIQTEVNADTIYKVGEKYFGRIPDFDEITFGEMVDLDSYLEMNDEGMPIHNFKALNWMGVLYRPIKDRASAIYNIEAYEGSHKHLSDIKQMPASAYIGSLVFFWSLRNDLLTATKTYIHQAETLVKQGAALDENGAGLEASISLLKETLKGLNQYPELKFIKHSQSSILKRVKLK